MELLQGGDRIGVVAGAWLWRLLKPAYHPSHLCLHLAAHMGCSANYRHSFNLMLMLACMPPAPPPAVHDDGSGDAGDSCA